MLRSILQWSFPISFLGAVVMLMIAKPKDMSFWKTLLVTSTVIGMIVIVIIPLVVETLFFIFNVISGFFGEIY